MVIAAIVTVAAIVALIVVAPYVTVSTKVNVSEIDVYAPDNVCGLSTNPVSYPGFSDTAGGRDAFRLQIVNFNTTACTLRGVTTNTSGFGLANVEVPVVVPGSSNGTLNLTIVLPSSGFSGVLNLIYT